MLDLVLLGFIGGYAFGGFRTGFVRRLASIVFLAIAFVGASYLREPVTGLLEGLFPRMDPGYPGFIAFATTFGALALVLNLAARPFLSRIAVGGMSRLTDQVLGAALGFAEAILLASIGIVIVTTYASDPPVGGFTDLGILPDIAEALESSTIARALMATTVPLVVTILGPLLPPDIDSVVDLLPTDR